MTDVVVTHSHVRNLANGTWGQGGLILWSEQEGESHLREATPGIFHDVAVEQDPLRIFQLKQVLDDKGIPVGAAYETRLTLLPDERLEHMVLSHFNIGRCHRCSATAEQDALPSR